MSYTYTSCDFFSDTHSRAFVAVYWPVSETTGSQIQSMYQGIMRQIQAEKAKEPKLFSKTCFGRLSPELRGKIFSDLLAFRPTFAGHDHCIKDSHGEFSSLIPLRSSIKLNGSYTTVLRTCRQIYFEAFPVLYASRSYCLVNVQDSHHFSGLGLRTSIGSRILRADTITSLCLDNLVLSTRPSCPGALERLYPTSHHLNREELEDLMKMTSLRKTYLCTRAGQERIYFEFVFDVRGLARGVVDIVDNFFWTIFSQSTLDDAGKIQYSDFASVSLQGKGLGQLNFDQVGKQAKLLGRESRTLDIVGHDQWVEDEPELHKHEDGLSEAQAISSEGIFDAADDTADDRSKESQVQLSDGDEQEHERENLQAQQSCDKEGAATSDGPDQEFFDLLYVAAGDDRSAQATFAPNQELRTLKRPSNQNCLHTTGETFSEASVEDLPGHIQTRGLDNETATVSDHGFEASMGLIEYGIENDQAQIGLVHFWFGNLERLDRDGLDPQLGAKTNATAEKFSGFQNQAHHNVQTDKTDQDGGQFLDQPEHNGLQSSGKVRCGKKTCSKLLPETGMSSNLQQPTEEPIESRIPEPPHPRMDSTEVSALKHISTLGWPINRHLSMSIRIAALMLALHLFNTIVHAELEDTLGQLLALVLGVLLTLMSVSSKVS